MNGYKNRVADRLLAEKLEAFGAVLIEGPKYCGKTTLASQQAGSILSMADTDTLGQNLALARTNISRLLAGETPRLIDEWQIAPQFSDAVRMRSISVTRTVNLCSQVPLYRQNRRKMRMETSLRKRISITLEPDVSPA